MCNSTIWNVYCVFGTVKYEKVMGYKTIITGLKENAKQGLERRKNFYSKHFFSEHQLIIALRYFSMGPNKGFNLYRIEGIFYFFLLSVSCVYALNSG